MTEKTSFKISKKEIVRGYKSFENILTHSKLFKTELLTGHLRTNKLSLKNSPLKMNTVKVGFIISKKKIRKSNNRIKIKRLIKEAYRLNRHNYLDGYNNVDVQLLIGINQNSNYVSPEFSKSLNYELVKKETENLLSAIRDYLTRQEMIII